MARLFIVYNLYFTTHCSTRLRHERVLVTQGELDRVEFEFNRQDLITKLNLAWNSIMTRLLRSVTLALTSEFTSQSYVKANLEGNRITHEDAGFYSIIPRKEHIIRTHPDIRLYPGL